MLYALASLFFFREKIMLLYETINNNRYLHKGGTTMFTGILALLFIAIVSIAAMTLSDELKEKLS